MQAEAPKVATGLAAALAHFPIDPRSTVLMAGASGAIAVHERVSYTHVVPPRALGKPRRTRRRSYGLGGSGRAADRKEVVQRGVVRGRVGEIDDLRGTVGRAARERTAGSEIGIRPVDKIRSGSVPSTRAACARAAAPI